MALETGAQLRAGRAMARLDQERLAARAGVAVNTVRIQDGIWTGHNTDVAAARDLLRPLSIGAGATVAVIGAGDSARSLGGMLAREGAEVTLFARDEARGRATATAIGARAVSLDALPGARWDLLVQATPLGRRGERLVPRTR